MILRIINNSRYKQFALNFASFNVNMERFLTAKSTENTKVRKKKSMLFFVLFASFVVSLNIFPGTVLLADDKSIRKTYVLVVGIDNYPTAYGNLNYAAKDAEMFASVMQEFGIADSKREKEEFVYSNKPEVVLLSDKTRSPDLFPTKDNILRQLDSFLENVKEDDFVILFFSGHGTGESLVTVTQNGKVETIELKEILNRLDTKTKEYMIFLDACRNTDNTIAPFTTTLEPGEGGYKSIFYSTGKDSVSQESKKLGQGVYSYYLVEGLMGAADVNKDLVVSSDEIRNYVSENVIAYTANTQKPQLHQISSATKFIARVNKPSPMRYLWKSAIIPGMGQWEKGHRANSIFFFSSALLGSLFLYSENVLYNKVQNDYYSRQSLLLLSSPMILDTTDLILFQATESTRKDLISQAKNIEGTLDLFLLFYLWNLWDAGFTKNEWIDMNKPKVKFDSARYINPTGQQEQQFRIATEWRF